MLQGKCSFLKKRIIALKYSQMPILFSTKQYQYLKNELLENSIFKDGEIERNEFPDGEIYHRIVTNLHGQEVVLLGGTLDDANTMELYDLAQGIVHSGAKSLKIVIPYFGYATMERAVKVGEVVKAKNRALLFSAIPMCEKMNMIYLMDLHSEGIPYYFDRDVRTEHLYCKRIIMEAIEELNIENAVLAATDAGRAKWVESLALDMNMKSAFVYKQRLSGSETLITGVNADVKDKSVIIYDDMIRTGGSLISAAKAYQTAGAKEIIAITSHGLFTNNAMKRIEDCGLFSKVISSNTHPNSLLQNSKLLHVKSVVSVIFEVLK